VVKYRAGSGMVHIASGTTTLATLLNGIHGYGEFSAGMYLTMNKDEEVGKDFVLEVTADADFKVKLEASGGAVGDVEREISWRKD
jgi:hypothetical protein